MKFFSNTDEQFRDFIITAVIYKKTQTSISFCMYETLIIILSWSMIFFQHIYYYKQNR